MEESRGNPVFCRQKGHEIFHDAMKTVQDPNSLGATQLHSAEGSTLLTGKDAIFERLTEHTNSVLNRP